MLRKETKEFLNTWPKKDSKDPKIIKLREKYRKANPAQKYKRVVDHANTAIDDLAFILDKLPSKYRSKVELGKQEYVDVLNRIRQKDPKLKLIGAIEQADAAFGFIGDMFYGGGPLKTLFEPRYKEIKALLDVVEQYTTPETIQIRKRLGEDTPMHHVNLLRSRK